MRGVGFAVPCCRLGRSVRVRLGFLLLLPASVRGTFSLMVVRSGWFPVGAFICPWTLVHLPHHVIGKRLFESDVTLYYLLYQKLPTSFCRHSSRPGWGGRVERFPERVGDTTPPPRLYLATSCRK